MAQLRPVHLMLFLVVTAFLVIGASCGGQYRAVVIDEALLDYFDGGYVPYALPGRGPSYEPGTIIRYQKKAEVIVRQRNDCFPLDTLRNELEPPTVKWSKQTTVAGALSLVLPKTVVSEVSAKLEARNAKTAALQLGTLSTVQLVEGAVRDRQHSVTFPEFCKAEYGRDNILVLGTVGSKIIRYQLQDSAAVDAAISAATQIKVGGNVKFQRSSSGSNVLEVVSDQVTVLGYIPYELKVVGPVTKGVGDKPGLALERVPAARALELRRSSD